MNTTVRILYAITSIAALVAAFSCLHNVPNVHPADAGLIDWIRATVGLAALPVWWWFMHKAVGTR